MEGGVTGTDRRSYVLAKLAAIRDALPKRCKSKERVDEWRDTLARAPKERFEIILKAIGVVEPALEHLCDSSANLADLLPQYPNISDKLRARLILGERPVDLAPGLTRAEAHLWLIDGAKEPAYRWLVKGIPGAESVKSMPVARWLLACWNDPPRKQALLATREYRVFGTVVRGAYIRRIDEIEPADLQHGASSGVDSTFNRAVARLAKEKEAQISADTKPLAPVPHWWSATRARCARLLITGRDLAEEGKAMKHCVAFYHKYVKRGDVVIVALNVLGNRSTVEVNRKTAAILQHRGYANGDPPELCERALKVLHRRWKAAISNR